MEKEKIMNWNRKLKNGFEVDMFLAEKENIMEIIKRKTITNKIFMDMRIYFNRENALFVSVELNKSLSQTPHNDIIVGETMRILYSECIDKLNKNTKSRLVEESKNNKWVDLFDKLYAEASVEYENCD